MNPEFFLFSAISSAAKLLPPTMDGPAARAMVLAICLQESKLQFRKQVGGPARGYAQFESGGGVVGVLTHPSVATHTKVVCAALDIPATQTAIYTALEHNDVLVAALARLLLWTLPGGLPTKQDPDGAWGQYISAWRPGKPHRDTWNNHYAHAWAIVEETATVAAIDHTPLIQTFIEALDKLRAIIHAR